MSSSHHSRQFVRLHWMCSLVSLTAVSAQTDFVPGFPKAPRSVTVSPAQNLVPVSSHGVYVPLNSAKHYLLSASGSASLGGGGILTSKVFYQAWIASGSGDADQYIGELVAGAPKNIGGSTGIYLCFIDDGTPGNNDNSGSIDVTVSDLDSWISTVVSVSANQNISAASSTAVHVKLKQNKTYSLTATGTASLGGAGVITSKLFFQSWIASGSGSADSYFGELSAGGVKTITGSTDLYLFFIDDGTPGSNDNSGSMKVMIHEE